MDQFRFTQKIIQLKKKIRKMFFLKRDLTAKSKKEKEGKRKREKESTRENVERMKMGEFI